MTIKPILFSTPMVKAILDGRKTQTRRTLKGLEGETCTVADIFKLKKIYAGDILWVRETWFPTRFDYMDMLNRGIKHFVKYKADNDYDPKKDCVGRSWKPSIHMPKAACRIFLEVTNVKVERLHDISNDDAKAEGIENHYLLKTEGYKHYTRIDKFIPFGDEDAARTSFFSLWMSINGAESLDANPWVWVYDFKRVEKPKDL